MRQDLRAAVFGFDRAGENFRYCDLVFAQMLLEEGDVVLHAVGRLLIDFGEDQAEGYVAAFHPLDEGEIDDLRGQPGVDQDEDVAQKFAFLDVVADSFVEIKTLLLGDLGIALAGQIDE